MIEKKQIEKILSCFPKSHLHQNNYFESDAEVFNYKNNQLLITTDEFSSEDLFRDNNPFQLGKNIAIATVSDIFASGGEPLFYSHSMVVSKNWKKNFITDLSKGIADIIKKINAHFLGGDFGTAENWHYTGIALGEVKQPLSRIGAKPSDSVYFTGKAGSGNLEAALYLYSDNKLIGNLLKSYSTKFHCRINEARLIRNYASSCIDTSDGVFNGINTISSLNQSGFHLHNIPVLPEAKVASKLLRKSEELLILGECGEYELLFTVPSDKIEIFEQEIKIQQLDIHKIGLIKEKDFKTIDVDNKSLNLNNFEISARSFKNPKEYLDKLIEFVNSEKQ